MAPRLTAARRCCRDGPHIPPGGFAIFLSQDWTWCYRDGAYIQWDWAQSTGQDPWNTLPQQQHPAAHARRPRCCSCLGNEPTPSHRAAAVARLGPALALLARSGQRSACAAAAFSFSGGRRPGARGCWGLRAREALQPDTLGSIFALGPGAVLDREDVDHLAPLAAAAQASLKRAAH